MSKKKNLNKNVRRITQGGYTGTQGTTPDIVLQMPQVFFFDMAAYMNAVTAALNIDHSYRVRLYDMYESAMFDLHLSGVLDKRLRGVTRLPIEFRRDGVPDERINAQLKSPWFKELRKELILSEFWGYTLVQFYTDEEENIRYDLIPRKHFDPVSQRLLRYQGDMAGTPIDEFSNMLFVGKPRALGIFAELMPAVLYKRGDMADWAKFCNIFGMPIREYTYDAGDEAARRQLIADAKRQGTNAVYIHPTGSNLNLIESGNKSGSSDLYKTFADYWDSKISIRVLGNTLTTDAKETGTQALGEVHKDEEDDMNADDREFILNVLNYEMKPIFAALGYNVEGGEFVYARKDKINLAQHVDVISKLNALGLPISDDYLYNTFGIEKPEDYEQIKAEKEAQKEALRERLNGVKTPFEENQNGEQTPPNGQPKIDPEEEPNEKKGLLNSLRSFFGLAPDQKGAYDF